MVEKPTRSTTSHGKESVDRGLNQPKEVPGPLTERLCRVDLCEVFSPPRVGVQAVKYGLKLGEAMDLTTGWDFTWEEDREKRKRTSKSKSRCWLLAARHAHHSACYRTGIPDTPDSRKKWQ